MRGPRDDITIQQHLTIVTLNNVNMMTMHLQGEGQPFLNYRQH